MAGIEPVADKRPCNKSCKAVFGVPSMFDNLEVRLRLNSAEVKSSTQPDGG